MMMKSIVILGALCGVAANGIHGQKPVIDTSAFEAWGWKASGGQLSPNGQYFVGRIDVPGKPSEVTIQSADDKWRKRFPNLAHYEVLSDNRSFMFQRGDSLFRLQLGHDHVSFVALVSAFEILRGQRDTWLCYQEKETNRLTLQQISGKRVLSIDSVSAYWYHPERNILVVQKHPPKDDSTLSRYVWKSLATGAQNTIWQGNAGTWQRVMFDDDGKQLVLITSQNAKTPRLWYYAEGMGQAKELTFETEKGSSLSFNPVEVRLTGDGKNLLFYLTEKRATLPKGNGVPVDVWSYRDPWLQSTYLKNANEERSYLASLNIQTGKLHQLEDSTHRASPTWTTHGYIIQTEGTSGENYEGNTYWRTGITPSAYLVSLATGERTFLTKLTPERGAINISAGDRFVVYADSMKGVLYSYDITTGTRRKLDRRLDSRDEIYGWLDNDRAFLISDGGDLWQVDPLGAKPSINLTNGYAAAHHLVFHVFNPSSARVHPERMDMLFEAFDTVTKHDGYYRFHFRADHPAEPQRLTMGPYHYGWIQQGGDHYLVQRESATEAPNYYLTTDFHTFAPLTAVAPQRRYNWITAELRDWRLPNGETRQGALYKPENFDSTKKYPLIVLYYRNRTDEVYRFQEPGPSGDEVNMPYFVSRGFIVFEPDIVAQKDKPGRSALETVESGVRSLSREPWFDEHRIGIQGHSYGGFETNYIVTHSHMFAAAAESAGPADMVSDYGRLYMSYNNQDRTVSTYNMTGNIWNDLDNYLENSPILNADKVTTPLLMTHNKGDYIVRWEQGLEFFNDLRRNNKTVWMLQYDNGGHGESGRDALDYTVRVEEFFDHYLKGAPPPKWMTQGIPARLKGIDNGYELDPQGACSAECGICQRKNYTSVH